MFIKNLSQHSRSFYILFFAEFLGRFSHWGVQTLLIFYLTSHIDFAQNYAYLVVGTYTALTFVSAIIGGVISDKLLGFNKAVILGLILVLVGNGMLLLQGNQVLFLGLALICLGTGIFIPNNANLAGSLYPDQLQKSEAFSFYYMAT